MGERELSIDHEANAGGVDELAELLARPPEQRPAAFPREDVTVGELLAVLDAGRTPVIAISAGTAGVRGRTTIDLHGDDVGQRVVVVFERGDIQRPIVVGVLRSERTTAPTEVLGKVDVSADGERMIIDARHELVLRCGKASITLKQDGTVQIVGERVLSRAKAANRVQGGSVHLN